MEMVVANKKRYVLSASGKILKDHVEDVRKGMVVSADYVETINAGTGDDKRRGHGVVMEIDKKATKIYHEQCEKENAKRKEAKELEQALALSRLKDAAGVAQSAIVDNLKDK
jgi:hypothetical protein